MITVGLNDVPDERLRHELMRQPTSLALPQNDVQALQAAGREALRASPEFRRLVRSPR